MSGDNNFDNEETVKVGRRFVPQMMWFEALAWFEAQSPGNYRIPGLASLAKWKLSQGFVSSLVNVERALATPLFKKITKNKNDNSVVASVARYLQYVWIDATSTSSVVSASYSVSVFNKKKELDNSESNILYRALEFTYVSLLKIPIAIMAIGTLVLMAVFAILAGVSYVLTFRNLAKTMMGLIGDTFNNIYSSLLSYTNWNVFYPIMVAVPGLIIKTILAAAALALLPLTVFIALPVAAIANRLGYTKNYDRIMSSFNIQLGIIATLLISNLNPIFAFKTVFFDTFAAISVVSRFNSNKKAGQLEKKLPLGNAPRDTSSDPKLNIHKEKVPEIVAAFKIEGVKTTDVVKNAAKALTDSGHKITFKPGPGVRKFFSTVPSVLEIRNPNNIVGVIHTEITEDNNINLKLQFTNDAGAEDRMRIGMNFARTAQGIAKTGKSKAINLDVSNFPSTVDKTKEDMVANILNLNKNTGAVSIKILDQKRESSTAVRASIEQKKKISSDEFELKDQESTGDINDSPAEDNSEGSARMSSSRSRRRGGLPSGFVDDHGQV